MSTHQRSHRSPSRIIQVAATVAALLALLVLAACSGGASGSSTIDAIRVTEPASDTTVGQRFTLDTDTGAPIGPPDTGRQHVHVYYDVDPGGEDYDIVYELPFTTRRLSPGPHTLHVVVANSDHSITDVRETVPVMVEPGGGGNGVPDAPPPTNGSPGGESPPGY